MSGFECLVSNLNTTETTDSIFGDKCHPALPKEQEQAMKNREMTASNVLAANLPRLQTGITALNSEEVFAETAISVSDENLLTATGDGQVGTGSYFLNFLSSARDYPMASHAFAGRTIFSDQPAAASMYRKPSVNGNVQLFGHRK